MSPRAATRFVLHLQRPATLASAAGRRFYSTEPPLIRVTNLPAPSTGHIRILELNRPSARNAISSALLKSLSAEIEDVHSQYDAVTGEELAVKSWDKKFGSAAGQDDKGPTRAVILASAVDQCFCAGADLKERRGFTPDEYVFSFSVLPCVSNTFPTRASCLRSETPLKWRAEQCQSYLVPRHWMCFTWRIDTRAHIKHNMEDRIG